MSLNCSTRNLLYILNLLIHAFRKEDIELCRISELLGDDAVYLLQRRTKYVKRRQIVLLDYVDKGRSCFDHLAWRRHDTEVTVNLLKQIAEFDDLRKVRGISNKMVDLARKQFWSVPQEDKDALREQADIDDPLNRGDTLVVDQQLRREYFDNIEVFNQLGLSEEDVRWSHHNGSFLSSGDE